VNNQSFTDLSEIVVFEKIVIFSKTAHLNQKINSEMQFGHEEERFE
jgi:hypothetical protein